MSAGLLLVVVSAVLFSTKAIFVKLSYARGVDAITFLALRMAFSLPVFVGVAAFEERRARQKGLPRLTWRDRGGIVALGLVGYYLASLFDFIGLGYVSAGLERLVLFAYPTFAVLLEAALFGRRVRLREAVALATSYAGILIALGGEAHATAPRGLGDGDAGGRAVWIGSLWVLASAVTYAVYLVGAGRMIPRIGATRLVAHAMVVACVAVLTHFLLVRLLVHAFGQPARPVADTALRAPGLPAPPESIPSLPFGLSPDVVGYGALTAIVATVLPTLLLGEGIGRIGASRAAIAGLVGPIATIALAWAVLGERFGALQAVGTALVLAAVASLGSGKPNR